VVRRLHPSLDGRVNEEKMLGWMLSTTTTAPFTSVGHGAPGYEVRKQGSGFDRHTPFGVQHVKLADTLSASKRVTWDLSHE
jgi:hypothetical protein